mmetsp:Transcript_30998/g.61884  ORF Transcript_30998/g.61884 Transcript_30998/m.61884 type:complete len:613 (-) Transcript_30998:77-1915(-)
MCIKRPAQSANNHKLGPDHLNHITLNSINTMNSSTKESKNLSTPDKSMSKSGNTASSNKDPLDRVLFDAARRTLKHVRAAAEKQKTIPLETKIQMLEVDFPPVRHCNSVGGRDEENNEIVTDEFDCGDCVKTLTLAEIHSLHRALQNNDKEKNFQMLKAVWDQMKEFHHLLEENETLKSELESLRRKCQSLQAELSEKNEELTTMRDLERDIIDIKVDLAEAKGSSDVYEMKTIKLEAQLKKVKSDNDRLLRESLKSSFQSNFGIISHDENPNGSDLKQVSQRRSFHLARSWNDDERDRNAQDSELVAASNSTSTNLLSRSCKWVISSTRNLIDENENSEDKNYPDGSHNSPKDLTFQRGELYREWNSKQSTNLNSSFRHSLIAHFASSRGRDSHRFHPLKQIGLRRRSWSSDSINDQGNNHNDTFEAAPKSKSFFANPNPNIYPKDRNNSVTWGNVIWDGRSGSGETEDKSSFFQRRVTVQASNPARPYARAESHDFTGEIIVATSHDDMAKCDEDDHDDDCSRMSAITLDTVGLTLKQEPGSSTEEKIGAFACENQKQKSMILRHIRNNKKNKSMHNALSLLHTTKQGGTKSILVHKSNPTEDDIALAFC